MGGLNDAADGIVAVVRTIDANVEFYPGDVEEPKAGADGGGVSGTVGFDGGAPVGAGPNSRWDYGVTLTLSTPALKADWEKGLRRIRDLVSPDGTKSLFRAFLADQTLGDRVVSLLPAAVGLGPERQVEYPDGIRWQVEAFFKVRIASND